MSAARLVLVVALAGVASVASAHHGSAISYDLSKQVTLTGVVTEWVWKNPHCFVLFDVTDEQGTSPGVQRRIRPHFWSAMRSTVCRFR